MSHPIDKLFLKDGELFQMVGATEAPYMNVPEISIIKKGVATPPNPDEQGPRCWKWMYSFTLNACTDFTWDELFYKNGTLRDDAEFKGTSMLLTCPSEDLKERYDAIKAAMRKANAEYKVARANLIKRVEQEQRTREGEAQRKAEEERKIKEEFDKLEL